MPVRLAADNGNLTSEQSRAGVIVFFRMRSFCYSKPMAAGDCAHRTTRLSS